MLRRCSEHGAMRELPACQAVARLFGPPARRTQQETDGELGACPEDRAPVAHAGPHCGIRFAPVPNFNESRSEGSAGMADRSHPFFCKKKATATSGAPADEQRLPLNGARDTQCTESLSASD